MINPAGDVYPCLSIKIGNVKDKKIKELFNNPKYCCFRKNLKATGGTFGACQMCCELELKTGEKNEQNFNINPSI
jgi:radical SAM protein with 4Fe4S-binding SPASM domain